MKAFAVQAGQALYDYWIAGPGIGILLAFVFRSRIARQWRRLMLALRNTQSLVRANDALRSQLVESEERAEDWRERFDDLERRYEALKVEFAHLGDDLETLRQRMTTAEERVRLLVTDRDLLVTHSRLLTGQLVESGIQPAYPAPALGSIIPVPPRATSKGQNT